MQRLARTWHQDRVRVGFVPTMGYLHAGHISLIARARRLVGRPGRVVVSIYVNPTQFSPNEDLAKYPRDLKRDRAICKEAGVDYLFIPTDAEMYPRDAGLGFSTYVVEETVSRGMEGAARPTHFRGVCTVVAKLFHIVQPDWAVFGQKDFQQAAVIQRMVRDLNFGVKIVVAPTVREKDGLAMSSRNKYLSKEQRDQAVVLWESVQWARHKVRSARGPVSARKLEAALRRRMAQQAAVRVDYISFFDPATLEPAFWVRQGTQVALAAFVGRTRLIDNARL